MPKTLPLLFLFVTLGLGGCASYDGEVMPAQNPQTETPQEALSRGASTTIKTSQGEITVEPTVVDMESGKSTEQSGDPPTSANVDQIYSDPLEPWNRAMFSFNHYAYSYVMTPLAKGYKAVLPEAVRSKIGNAFSNIREPLNFVNNLAAGEGSRAGKNLGRFLINTTIGIFGLFDPAEHWFGIEPAQQSIADTLTDYGVASGAYLVLPLLGQSDVRGLTSTLGEGFLHPVTHLTEPPDTYYILGTDALDEFSEREEIYHTLYEQAQDPYIYFRNQYLQGVLRDAQFKPK